MVFRGIEVAGTKHDGKQRQHQRHDQRRILGASARGVRTRADQQIHPEHDALEL
ncbi:hypothetical protein D3C84_956240 [compost metagenome]